MYEDKTNDEHLIGQHVWMEYLFLLCNNVVHVTRQRKEFAAWKIIGKPELIGVIATKLGPG